MAHIALITTSVDSPKASIIQYCFNEWDELKEVLVKQDTFSTKCFVESRQTIS